jgi:hypothetical protein
MTKFQNLLLKRFAPNLCFSPVVLWPGNNFTVKFTFVTFAFVCRKEVHVLHNPTIELTDISFGYKEEKNAF